MKCAEARFLITMHRPGERTTGQDVFLSEHLDICPECSSWKAHYDEALPGILTQLRREPRFPDAETLTNAVVEQTIRVQRPPARRTIIDTILEPGAHPAVQRVLLAGVSFVILLFALQISLLFSSIHSMETSLSYRPQPEVSSALRVDRALTAFLSAETKEVIARTLGVNSLEETLSALSRGDRTAILERARRLDSLPLQMIARERWKEYVKSVTKTGQL